MERKVTIVASHPIQYQVPLFETLFSEGHNNYQVLYKSDHGLMRSYSSQMQIYLRYNNFEGLAFDHKFLKNFGVGHKTSPPFGQINPQIIYEVWKRRDHIFIVLGYKYVTDFFLIAMLIIFKVPFFLRCEVNLRTHRSKNRGVIKRSILKWVFRSSQGAFSIGRLNKEFYKNIYPAMPVINAPYCVPQTKYLRDEARVGKTMKDKWGEAGSGKFYVLFVGKLIARKAVEDLVSACELLPFDVVLSIIGDGPKKETLQARAEQSSSNVDVKLIGFVNQNELADYYRCADVFVLPSREDTWGLVVNEALSFGTPCIVSDACGCAFDLIYPGVNGLIYPAGDSEMLARCIQFLKSQKRERKECFRAEVMDTIAPYSIPNTAREIDEHISSIRI